MYVANICSSDWDGITEICYFPRKHGFVDFQVKDVGWNWTDQAFEDLVRDSI